MRSQHHALSESDACWFYGDYISGEGYQAGRMNQLILNFKKKPTDSNKAGYEYKAKAISEIQSWFEKLIPKSQSGPINDVIFVPIPGSKAKADPDHDDRMLRILQCLSPRFVVLDLIETVSSRQANHSVTTGRLNTDELFATLRIVPQMPSFEMPPNADIVLVDDVLTTGASFSACKRKLVERWPHVRVVGIFIARTIHRVL